MRRAETSLMTRLDTFLLLLLAGIGWACGFALIGLALFKGYSDGHAAAAVFGGFGFAAGLLLAGLRLAMADQLPRLLSNSLRQDKVSKAPEALDPAHASVFGA